jgi:O-antigen ligase
MRRALAWLVGGLVVFGLLLVAIAPELLAAPEIFGGFVGLALLAVVPALLLAAIYISYRRRRPSREER